MRWAGGGRCGGVEMRSVSAPRAAWTALYSPSCVVCMVEAAPSASKSRISSRAAACAAGLQPAADTAWEGGGGSGAGVRWVARPGMGWMGGCDGAAAAAGGGHSLRAGDGGRKATRPRESVSSPRGCDDDTCEVRHRSETSKPIQHSENWAGGGETWCKGCMGCMVVMVSTGMHWLGAVRLKPAADAAQGVGEQGAWVAWRGGRERRAGGGPGAGAVCVCARWHVAGWRHVLHGRVPYASCPTASTLRRSYSLHRHWACMHGNTNVQRPDRSTDCTVIQSRPGRPLDVPLGPRTSRCLQPVRLLHQCTTTANAPTATAAAPVPQAAPLRAPRATSKTQWRSWG